MTMANKVTIFRILLIPIFIISITYGYYNGLPGFKYVAVLVFIICVITDALDGFIARSFNQETALGRFLDPLADKLLLISAFVFLGLSSIKKIPVWVTLLVVSRECILFLGWLVIHLFGTNKNHITPSILGKITTFLQMLTIFLCLIGLPYLYLRWIIFLMVATTIISCLDYIFRESKRLSCKIS